MYHSSARSGGLAELETFRQGAWINVEKPTPDELEELAATFNLEIDLLKDALDLYEAPRVEQENGVIYVFTRYYFVDDEVINATEPVLFVYHPDCFISIERTKSDIFKSQTSGVQNVVTTQKTKLLLQLFFEVNNSYQRYVNQATRHIFMVRSELKRTTIKTETLLGLVEIEDDLNEILSALQPHAAVLRSLLSGRYLKLYEEDEDLIEDLSLNTNELIELVKSRLKSLVNIRQAYEALATSDLNRTFKRLTSISIFLMVPTIMAGLYGMNVILPFQNYSNAFWIVIVITSLLTSGMLWYFNRKHWL